MLQAFAECDLIANLLAAVERQSVQGLQEKKKLNQARTDSCTYPCLCEQNMLCMLVSISHDIGSRADS